LKMALRHFPADVILVDSLFFATLPMLLGPREKRPAIVHLGVSVSTSAAERTSLLDQEFHRKIANASVESACC